MDELASLVRTAAGFPRRRVACRQRPVDGSLLPQGEKERRIAGGSKIPPLLIFSDPQRLPSLEPLAHTAPKGAGLVLRTFGDPAAEAEARHLATLARRRGLVLLVGADEALAAAIGADGIHLPERLAARAPAIRSRHPRWLITIAAHSPAAARRAVLAGADAVVVSAVFHSASPSARPPIGPHRLAAVARSLSRPVYALGGVNGRTIKALARSGVVGAALIGAAAQKL